MILHVVDAKYVADYKIWVAFSSGKTGTIDLSDELTGEVFEPLKDLNQFKRFCIHPIMETIVWENGADFAPEYLESLIQDPIKKVG